MSSAELVRNPDPNTSVYRWEAVGVDELNRQNKLTSLPFWVPNSTTRRHQFKLVLLRGLVPSADPAQDAFGLLVELIPPPTEGQRGSGAAAVNGGRFPGGCAVTCVVVPADAAGEASHERGGRSAVPRDKLISSTKTAVLDESNAQISFSDFIPADVLANARYVSGSPKSLTVQVTIETGISVPLHQVATTAYSFFSSLSSSVSQLLGTTTHLVHEGRENLNAILSQAAATGQPAYEATTRAAAGARSAWDSAPSPAAAVPLPPWDRPPEEWRGRAEAWRSLLRERLASLGGTYRQGVEKTLAADEVALLAEVGLSESELWARYAIFDFDRDVHEILLTCATVAARRYQLVPAKIREETFWANYFWKAHCVGLCVTARQVSAVLAALCTPPRPLQMDASAPVEEVLRAVADAVDVAAVLRDFVERGEAGEAWCTVVAETARHCVAVLRVASQRTDISVLTVAQLTKTTTELEAVLAAYGEALATPSATPLPEALPVSAPGAAEVETLPAAASQPTSAEEERRAVSAPALADTTAHESTDMGGDNPSSAETGVDGLAPASSSLLPQSPAVEAPGEVRAVAAPSPPRHDGEHPLPASPTAVAPTVAPTVAQAASPSPTKSDAARSSSRIEFAKMPWEEEDA